MNTTKRLNDPTARADAQRFSPRRVSIARAKLDAGTLVNPVSMNGAMERLVNDLEAERVEFDKQNVGDRFE